MTRNEWRKAYRVARFYSFAVAIREYPHLSAQLKTVCWLRNTSFQMGISVQIHKAGGYFAYLAQYAA